eukprot:gene2228-2746_t
MPSDVLSSDSPISSNKKPKPSDSDDYYIGSVVEYSPIPYPFENITSENAIIYMMLNIKNLQSFVEIAASKGAQIVVLPEYGILGDHFFTRDEALLFLEQIPEPSKKPKTQIVPCGNYLFNDRPILQSLSCMALLNNIHVVANMGDVVPCNRTVPGCPGDQRFHYNTEIAFSNTGAILARYHKTHLYEEPLFDQPLVHETVTFKSNFGVTFGMMICFDILHAQPQTDLLEKAGIQHLVYSSFWVNMQFAYARSVQQSWSYTAGANILASNIGISGGSSGSGIYSNGEILASVINPTTEPNSQIAIAKIPKDPLKDNTQQHRRRRPMIHNNTTLIPTDTTIPSTNKTSVKNRIPFQKQQLVEQLQSEIQSGAPEINATITPFYTQPYSIQTVVAENNGLTCKFTYQINDVSQGQQLYILTSYKGIARDFFNAQVCFVSICPDNQLENCSQLSFSSNTLFNSFFMESNIDDEYHIVPTVTSHPFRNNLQTYNGDDNNLSLPHFNQPLISVALFGIEW